MSDYIVYIVYNLIHVPLYSLNILTLFLTTLSGIYTDMNYEWYIKEQQHLKTLLKLNKLIFLTDTFSTLYLHAQPPLRKSSNMTPSV